MSYKEIAMQAIYDRNKKYPDDYPTHKPYSEDEKRELDKIFGFPQFGAKLDTQKDHFVKGGKNHKNTVI